MGYDLDLCLDRDVIESDPSLLCPSCAQILLEPEKTECGHVYCKLCLKQLRRCKTCDSVLKKYSSTDGKARESVPVLLLAKLGNLTVRCAQNCEAVFRLKDFAQHCTKTCSKSLVPCSNRPVACDQSIPRYLLRDHLDNDCVYRRVQCNVCGFKTVHANLYLHERTKRCAQLATRRIENEQYNIMSNKIKSLNENLTGWSKWSQYNYVKQTDVKRDFIATLYANDKLQDEVDTSSPQYQRMLRYEQSHSVMMFEPDENGEQPLPPNLALPKLTYRSKMLPRRSLSVIAKPIRFFVCQRCDKLYTDNMPRSHKECRWHVGPLLLNTFGSTCSTCKRPSYQAGCQFGRHVLIEINQTAADLADRESNDELAQLTQAAENAHHAHAHTNRRIRNPSVTPVIEEHPPVFLTEAKS